MYIDADSHNVTLGVEEDGAPPTLISRNMGCGVYTHGAGTRIVNAYLGLDVHGASARNLNYALVSKYDASFLRVGSGSGGPKVYFDGNAFALFLAGDRFKLENVVVGRNPRGEAVAGSQYVPLLNTLPLLTGTPSSGRSISAFCAIFSVHEGVSGPGRVHKYTHGIVLRMLPKLMKRCDMMESRQLPARDQFGHLHLQQCGSVWHAFVPARDQFGHLHLHMCVSVWHAFVPTRLLTLANEALTSTDRFPPICSSSSGVLCACSHPHPCASHRIISILPAGTITYTRPRTQQTE